MVVFGAGVCDVNSRLLLMVVVVLVFVRIIITIVNKLIDGRWRYDHMGCLFVVILQRRLHNDDHLARQY